MVSGKYYGEMEISNRYRTFETIEATLENGSEKRNPLYPIRDSIFCFNNKVSNFYNTSVV
jgi:hypothetical protein